MRTTPFHPRLSELNDQGLYTHWQGTLSPLRYSHAPKHEYFAVRNSVGVFDTSPLYKYAVTGPDGTETVVVVSADGSQVEGEPRTEQNDADDAAENRGVVEAASVDWAAALETGRDELGDEVDELELGEDDGLVRWEVSVPGDGPGTTIVIDATTGDVVGTDD